MVLKVILIIAGAIVALIVLVVVIGMLLPRRHIASRTAKFTQPADKVWQAITDHANEPSWRTDLKSKTRLPDRNANPVWEEINSRGERMTMETLEMNPPRKNQRGRMVGRIADDDLPFGGTWTYEVTYIDENNSTLTITENGEVYNPIFRFMAKFIIGYQGTMNSYLKALSAKFGQQPILD
jgi:hypothetical protein